MGGSATGILVFGVDFGEELPDFLLDQDDCSDLDNFLFDEAELPSWHAEKDPEKKKVIWAQREKILSECPVEVIHHCSYDYGCYILAARGTEITAWSGEPKEIDVSKLNVSSKKVSAFNEWLYDHGIEDLYPRWLLCSMYG